MKLWNKGTRHNDKKVPFQPKIHFFLKANNKDNTQKKKKVMERCNIQENLRILWRTYQVATQKTKSEKEENLAKGEWQFHVGKYVMAAKWVRNQQISEIPRKIRKVIGRGIQCRNQSRERSGKINCGSTVEGVGSLSTLLFIITHISQAYQHQHQNHLLLLLLRISGI